jgi:hypothetical protein
LLLASRPRARTGEGRKRAKERGVRFGRPRKMTPHQRQEAMQHLAAMSRAEEEGARVVHDSRRPRVSITAKISAQAWFGVR